MTASYVLMTPAHNEADTLPETIQAVAAQTVRPRRWVIVSDRSTDATDGIVQKAAAQHPFIEFVRLDHEGQRNFASKVFAINAALERLRDMSYDFIGNLDADITFEPDYFERLLEHFERDERLGIAGGLVYDVIDGQVIDRGADDESIGGAVQMFRRACFEEIGGYLPLQGGHEDATALFAARRAGWCTQAFRDLPVMHHRETSSAGGSVLRGQFRQGKGQYTAGWSPLFVLARAFFRLRDRPVVLASATRTAGFYWALLTRREREIPPDLMGYIRAEQRGKLLGRFGMARAPLRRPAKKQEMEG